MGTGVECRRRCCRDGDGGALFVRTSRSRRSDFDGEDDDEDDDEEDMVVVVVVGSPKRGASNSRVGSQLKSVALYLIDL